jgi:hypothetical protein
MDKGLLLFDHKLRKGISTPDTPRHRIMSKILDLYRRTFRIPIVQNHHS